jgi:hypothetical protein
MLKVSSALLFSVLSTLALAQLPAGEELILEKLVLGNSVPENLLATRSIVFHDPSFREAQLLQIQEAFQKTGIDAIGYFVTDIAFAGKDVVRSHANYFNSREVSYLIFLSKTSDGYSSIITAFNGEQSFVEKGQSAWHVTNADLVEMLLTIFRTAINDQERKNFLINDHPETNFNLNYITGRRSDFYAIDLKVDNLAVPWFEDAAKDTLLMHFFKDNYPFRYGHTTSRADDSEYRKEGFHYVLCYLHTRGRAAREILGYNVNPNETAITSVTFPNGELNLKTISASTPVYKFYVKHIQSGNVFLGTKWDADVNWEDALRNYIKGFKAELKIN